MMKIRQVFRLIIYIMIISNIVCLGILNAEDNIKSRAISTALNATQKAIVLTKFADIELARNANTEQVELIQFSDSTTPFLGEYSINRKVWQVKFKDVQLSKFLEVNDDKIFNRNFDVFIDSLSGNLLKITCQNGIIDSTLCPPMDAKYAEEQILKAGGQYLGIPTEQPKIDFKTALMSCPYNPLTAKKIIGQYVRYTSGNRPPKDVWMITLIGIPPIQPKGGKADWIPIYQRNRIRIAVDAVTGKVIFATTNPGLPLTPEDKAKLFPDQE